MVSRSHLALGVALLLMCRPDEGHAQRHVDTRAGLTTANAGTPRRHVTRSEFFGTSRRSYWKEGGALTSLITLIAVNVWVRDVSASQRLLGSLALGGVFFVPGALIGGQFPKD